MWTSWLLLCALWIGFLAGATVGGRFLVPADSGLAGGPAVLGYGVMGAIAFLAVGFVVSRRLEAATVRRLALAALAVSAISAAVIAYLVVRQ